MVERGRRISAGGSELLELDRALLEEDERGWVRKRRWIWMPWKDEAVGTTRRWRCGRRGWPARGHGVDHGVPRGMLCSTAERPVRVESSPKFDGILIQLEFTKLV